MTEIYSHLSQQYLSGVTKIVSYGDPLLRKVAHNQPTADLPTEKDEEPEATSNV